MSGLWTDDVLVGQKRGPWRGPAYSYIRKSDELPTWDKRESDPMVKVKLFLLGSRFTYFVTAYTDDDGHRYVSGYCVSPLGPDCDEFGDMGADEIEGLRTPLPITGLPLERDLNFEPIRESELLRRLGKGEDV